MSGQSWRWVNPVLLVGLVAIMVIAPAMGMFSRYALSVLWYVCFYTTLSSSWNILGGFAGQVSFGYSAFLGLGAYTTGLLWLKGHWNPYLALPVGALVAAAFSVLVGLPTFRLRGPFFTIATIGVGEAMRVLMLGLQWTGGSSGLRFPSGGYNPLLYYYWVFLLAVATVVIAWWVHRSRFGLALNSIRQDVDAAEALGVGSTYYKVAAHAISAAIIGVAGGLYCMQVPFINPNSVFSFQLSLALVLMPVMGGIGTVAGPVLGGIMYGYVEKQLLGSATLRDFALLIYGSLLIVIMLFEPAGIMGALRRLLRWVGRITGKPPAAAKGVA